MTFVIAVEAPVDPMSGMTVNLAKVDSWLEALGRRPSFLHGGEIWEWLKDAWSFLEPLASAEGAVLSKLEGRSDGFRWSRARDQDGFHHETVREEVTLQRGADAVVRPQRMEFVLRRIEGVESWTPLEVRELAADGTVHSRFDTFGGSGFSRGSED